MSTELPATKDLRDMLEMLLGRDVLLSPGDPVETTLTPGPTTGVYVDDADCLSGVVLMDLPLTAYIGAAIGLVPAAGAQAAVEDWAVPQSLHDNACEVLNIMAALLGDASRVHQRLYETYAGNEDLPGDVLAWSAVPGPRRDVNVEVKGYGHGRLSIINALEPSA